MANLHEIDKPPTLLPMVKELDVIRAEQLLHQAEMASGAFLDALTDEIAILDGTGTIIAVNDAWKRFGLRQGEGTFQAPGVGLNYLDVCQRAADVGIEDARKAADGLRSVLRKASNQFVMDYEFVTPQEHLWFQLTATALAQMPGALVAHRDITGGKRAQEALRLGGQLDVTEPAYESFLPALVKNLATALHAHNAFLTELLDLSSRRARIVALWDGTGFAKSREYRIEGMPAEQILSGRACVFPSGVRKLFPNDETLASVDAESYIAVPLLDSSGAVLGHLGIVDTKPIDDVSFAETTLRMFAASATPELERRRIERRLAEQSRLIYNAPDAIVGTDDHFVITYWNRAAEKTYGWSADEVQGRDIREVLRTTFTGENRAQAVSTILEAGEYRGQVVQYRKDGTAINVSATTMPIRSATGAVTGVVSINRDISDRVRAQQALHEAEARNQAILRAIPDLIFTMDSNGRFLDFTPSPVMEPSVSPDVFIGKTMAEVLPPEIANPGIAAIDRALSTGQVQTFEYQVLTGDDLRDCEARVVPLGDGNVLALVRDYTLQKQRERALRDRFGAGKLAEGSALTRTGDKPLVLVVDPDVRAMRWVRRVLEEAGKKVIVTTDADEALHLMETERPDVVMLDLSFFEDEEANFFGELRRLSNAPVVVLGSADESESGYRAIKAGADDYVERPFSPAELDARVGLALRHRSVHQLLVGPLEFGDLVIDPASRVVTVSGERVVLTLTEYKLLLELAEATGRVLTHDEILERVWGPGYAGQYEVLRAFVRTLRQKLGDDARQPRFVISERGVGYRLAKA